jgi:hypothetical protein
VIDVFQGASTDLDQIVIRRLKEEKGKFATLMVTDGELTYPEKTIPLLKYMVDNGKNRLGMMYVGAQPTPRSITAMNDFADVLTVSKNGDIPSTMKKYSEFILKGE